ncbi:S-layer homology domain-containing protein [Lysinibacillus sp. OTC-L20]|uniref:S-layer homology domain-containing protein n=1 Tax=Lysinibacillus sp. OTC-L20 TaxID=3342791 RepID=UPI0035B8C021
MAKQNKGRKFFAASATAALVASAIVPVASAAQVNDYNKISGYAKEAVQSLVDAGVIQGDTNGNFNPLNTVTRAQAAEIFTKALELEADGDVNFSDVKKGAWYYNSIAAVVANGIFEGVSANEFAPNKSLTRSEAAKVLVDAFGLEGSESLSQFADASQVKPWAKDALETAVANGIFTGSEENGKLNLKPNAAITRQDFAVVFARTLDLAVETVDASVKAINATTVEVTFDEEVDNVEALKFKIDGLEVKNAAVKQTNKNVVVLTTEAQTADKEYVVTLDGEEIGKFKGIAAVVPTAINLTTTSVQGVVGQQVSLKAEVKVAEGQSKAGIPVTFNVDPYDSNSEKVSSLNKAQVVEVTTDENGVATYTYTQYNAGADQVVAYATGNPANRSFAKVYWGVKPILSLTSKEGNTLDNGKAKTYTATYLDPVTGTPVKNQELKVTFKENIDESVTNDTNAVATDVATGATAKPFESKTDQRVLSVKTNDKGEATFTVTGANTAVTPIVYKDSDALNTSGWNRLDVRDLQVKAEETKFVGGAYTFKFNKEEQFEAVAGKAFTYEVEVLKADGKPYAGGTATVALNELIDSSLTTNTEAYIVNNSKVKPVSGKTGVYTLTLDKDGKAKFDVKADKTEVSATPVVWIDINSASNVQGTLEKEESFKLAGSVVFRSEVIGSAKLEDKSDVTGVFGVSGTGLQQPTYNIQLLDQAGSEYSKNDYAVNRVTYTLSNTGNSAVDLTLAPTNFNVDSISNNNGSANLNVHIAAGQSVTVTGHTTTNPKNVALKVQNAKAGKVEVTGSVTTSVKASNGTWTTSNSYYSAGTTTSEWVDATVAGTEVTGLVKGFQTVDLGAGEWGYALVLVDGTSSYQIVKYGQSNTYFTGTQTDFNRLTSTDANGFEKAISLEDRLNIKNSEVRLINVDASNKDSQAKGNDTSVVGTGITQAVVNAVNSASNTGQVKEALKTVNAFKALSDADQNAVATVLTPALGTLYTVDTLTTAFNTAISTQVFAPKVVAVNGAATYAALIAAVKEVPGAASSVTALEAITDVNVQAYLVGTSTFVGTDSTTFNTSVTAEIAAAKASVDAGKVTAALAAVNTALGNVVSATDAPTVTAAIQALNDNAATLQLTLTSFNSLDATKKALVVDALANNYTTAQGLQTAINNLVASANDVTAPTIQSIATDGTDVVITFSENVNVTGTATIDFVAGATQATVVATGAATASGNTVTFTLTGAPTNFVSGVTVNGITGLTVTDTALTPNTVTFTGLNITTVAK